MTREKKITPQVLALQAAYRKGVEKKLWKGSRQCAAALRMKPTKFYRYFYGYIKSEERVVALTKKMERLVEKSKPAELHPLLRKLREMYAEGKKSLAWKGTTECANRIGMNRSTLEWQLMKKDAVLHTRLIASVKDTIQRMQRILPRETDPPNHGPPGMGEQLAEKLIQRISLKPLPGHCKPFNAGAGKIAQGIVTILTEAAKSPDHASAIQDGISSILQGIAEGCVTPNTTSVPVISAPLSDLLVAGLAEIGNWEKDGIRSVPINKLRLETVQTKEEVKLIKERVQELRRLLTMLNVNMDTSMREYAAQQLGPELRFLVIGIKQAGEVTPRDVQEYLEAIEKAHRDAEKLFK